MNSSEFIESLEKDDLIPLASPIMAWEMGVVDGPEEVAEYMYKGGPYPPVAVIKPPRRIKLSEHDHRPERKYWELVKKEMHLFLCAEDKKYADLWESLGSIKSASGAACVAVIAAKMGEEIGAQATIISGFIAVCLYAVWRIGKESFCQYLQQTLP